MATAPAQPIRKRKPRKIKPDEVKRLAVLGLTQVEIAKHQGVHPSSVLRFLKQHNIDKQGVDSFREARADVFADLQKTALHAQKAIIDSLFADGILSATDTKTKASLLASINAVAGTMYDKERLETGKSTANVSTLARILGSAFDGAHKPLKDKAS